MDMEPDEFDIGEAGRRPTPRKAALDALDRLLRAHAVLGGQRRSESPHGVLRPAREEELDLIEAVFLHCGVPLPDTLRAIYRRTLGVGNPVAALPVLAVPFLRAVLPPEPGDPAPAVVGLEAFEAALGLLRDETALDRPAVLALGHAELAGLTVSRNGLWSLADYRGRRDLPPPGDFALAFEAAFPAYVDQVLLLWANDLAGAVARPRDLDLGRGARIDALPQSVREARALLLSSRPSAARDRSDVQPLDSAGLLRLTRRGEEGDVPLPQEALVAVVGLPYGEFPRLADRIGPGTRLRLRPADDNPHDANAVEVWLDGERPARVGFVERRSAPRLRTLPQGAPAWRLKVVGASGQALACALELVPPQGKAPADPEGRDASPASPDLFSRPGPPSDA
ncbi:HIRAN domain-containing protein [Rubellimicrobium aerolatum]|uniref:HIRAN domain-containing protein n=1 Tax=Rubellimicrobium aerolatum TaxID=490979 RepID=A0ABW0SGS2_9RHOB|nr:HIRAN domain-containing protein [Rubellimicrobium aerolatum]MBP1805807.1 hypothetical protein [Rubellimicrobium aerolatum]